MRNKENIPHIVQDKHMIIGLSLKYKISTVYQFIKKNKEQKLQCIRINFNILSTWNKATSKTQSQNQSLNNQ